MSTDLLDELDNEKPAKDEDFDILSDMTEDSGTPWMPARDEDQPRGIQGVVSDVFTVQSDYADVDGNFDRPAVSVKGSVAIDAQGSKTKDDTEWSVRGLHSVLASELRKADAKRGDTIAIRYFGERPAKIKGRKPTHVYKVAVARKAA